jgi:signal transduction histidine kinase/ligand-binding sensor domain-containing protein
MKDGLSFGTVREILQDRRGFLWLATYGGGLNKYDGYQFDVYRHNPGDPTTLAHDVVNAIYEDSSGFLWAGTMGGLDRYDPASGTFTHYLEGTEVLSLGGDSTGMLWVGTWNGLLSFDPQGGTVTHTYQHDPADPDSPDALSHNIVLVIYSSRDGDLWIGTADGLDRFDRVAGTFTHYRYDPENPVSLSSANVRSILQDQQGNLWVGTFGGLNKLAVGESESADAASAAFIHYGHDPENAHSLSDNRVTSIVEDGDGRLWVGTLDGLNLLAPGSGQDSEQAHFTHFRHDPIDPHSLGHDFILSLYEDRSGVVWVGTSGGGVSKSHRRSSLFNHIVQGLSDVSVTAMTEDQWGNLWIGTVSGGINVLDRGSGSFTVYRHDPDDPNSLSDNLVYTVLEDHTGAMWVGTGNGWLERFDPQTGTFIHEQYLGSQVEKLVEDRLGSLWIGTPSGLFRLDPSREILVQFEHVENDPGSLSYHDIQVIYPDRSGEVWIGTLGGGVDRWDPTGERFTHYRHDPADPNSPSHHTAVLAFYQDPEFYPEVLWIGTWGGGLNRFDRAAQTFTHYTEKDGLPSDTIGCILADADGTLWLGTLKGLTRFDPRTETFLNFDEWDGLEIGATTPGACLSSRSGEFYLAGSAGFYGFYPEHIKENPHIPPVVITSFGIFNQTVRKDLSPNEHIQLSYRDDLISFEFAALDYTVPAKNHYAYIMEGLDEDWVYAGTRRYAEYRNLRPGDYVFRVKGANNDGVWNEQGAVLYISVTPPFWETWWFIGIVLLAFAGGLFGVYRLRVRSIEARSRELAKQVEERAIELRREIDQRLQVEEALRQSEMEKAVAAERSRLARELHDSVTQSLYSSALLAEAGRRLAGNGDLESTQNHLFRLGAISQQALKEMRLLIYELRPFGLEKEGLVGALQQRLDAVERRAGIDARLVAYSDINLPPDVEDVLFRIAQEALNNALKHASATSILVTIHIAKENGEQKVELEVEDNGKGFDIESAHGEGGVGLISMRERIEMLGGELIIQSTPGEGTNIRAEVPVQGASND